MPEIAKSTALMILTFFIVSLFEYIFRISASWLLTLEEYGILGVSLGFLAVLSVFITYGFPWGLTKFFSDGKRENLYKVFRSCLLGNFLIALGVSLLFYLLTRYILKLGEDYNQIILIILIIVLVTSIINVYIGALRGLFEFKTITRIRIIQESFKFIITILLLYLGYGVVGALKGMLIAYFITLVMIIFLIKDFKFWAWKEWFDGRTYRIAVPMFLGMLAMILLANLDLLAIKFLTKGHISNTLAGYYQATLIIGRIPLLVIGAVTVAAFPFISKYDQRDLDYSIMMVKYTLLFIFPISIAISLIPESIIKLFFPEIYTTVAVALTILSLGMGFLAISQVLAITFQALDKPKFPAMVLLGCALTQFVMLMFLIPTFNIVGAALSTTIACLIGLVVLGISYKRHYNVGIGVGKFLKLLISLMILGLFLVLFPHSSRVLTLIDLFIAGFLYLITLFLLRLLTEKDLNIIFSILPSSRYMRKIFKILTNFVFKLNNLILFNKK